MNCKPGDIAVVVRALDARFAYKIGAMCRVIRLYPGYAPAAWEYERLSPALEDPRSHLVLDCVLRPIRPQDDDATDESLLWAPAPEKVLA
jgi:hypothetical protein